MGVTLTPDEVATLNSYGTAVKTLQQDIAKAKRAGLDTSALEANLARVDSVRRGLLKEFSPTSGS